METMDSWYATLGLSPGASRADIKRAYRRLAKVWHPDRFTTDATRQQDALDHFYRLTEAYHALRTVADTPEAVCVAAERPRSRWRGARWSLGIASLGLSGIVVLRSVLWQPQSPPVLRPPVTLSTPSSLVEPLPPRRYITVGSTKEAVRSIQGAPTVETERFWEYRGSRLYFQAGRVSGWDIWPTAPLQVQLLPMLSMIPGPTYFTIGATKDEVLAVQGTPTRLTESVWEYGASRVFFTDNRVSKWDEWPGAPLAARHPAGTAVP